MRVSTLSMQNQGVTSILDKQSDLTKTELQLATGRKILRPSEDPVNSSITLNIKESIAISEQFLRNADMVNASLSFQESTLEGVNNNIQRARELTLQGINDTNSPESRKAIAMELQQIREALFNLANARNEQGEYIFAGSKTPSDPGPFKSMNPQTEEVTYEGSSSNRQIQIGVGQKVIARDSGVDVFGDPGGSEGDDLFTTLGNLVEWLNPADPEDPQVLSSDGLLTNLDKGLDRVLTVEAKIGARMNMIERHTDVERSYMDKLKETLSGLSDVDYAETIAKFNLEQVGMQAAQQAYTKIQGLSLFQYI